MTQPMLGALAQEPGTDLFSTMVFNGTPENVELPDNLDEPFESIDKSLMDLTAYESDAKFKLERIFERLNYLNRVGFINRSIAAECIDLLPPEWQKRGINHYSITGTKHNYKFAMEGLSAGGWALVAAGIGALVLIILKIMDIFGYGFGGGGGGGGGGWGGDGGKRNNNIRSFEEHSEIVEAATRTNTELENKILQVLGANDGKINFPETLTSNDKYTDILAAYKKLSSPIKDVPLNQETFKKVMYAISSVRTQSDSVIHVQKETNGATEKDEFYHPGFLFIKNISINKALLDSNSEIDDCVESIAKGLKDINPTYENVNQLKNRISIKTADLRSRGIDELNAIFNDSKLNNITENNLILSYKQFDELFMMFESDKYSELFKKEFSSSDEFSETMKKISVVKNDLDDLKKKVETTQNSEPETMKSTLLLIKEIKDFVFIFNNFYQRVYKLRENFAKYPIKFTNLLKSTANFLNAVAKENGNENIFDLAALNTIIETHSAKIKP